MSIMFVDESGDLGKTEVRGEYFVMVGVVVDAKRTNMIDVVMNALREELGWREGMEFKFAKTRVSILRRFAQEMNKCDYQVYAVIVEKTLSRSNDVRFFYNQVLTELVRLVGQDDLKIVIDGKVGKKYRRTTATYVRQKLSGEYYIKGIKYCESQKENTLQLADLFAGFIHNGLVKGWKFSVLKGVLMHRITRVKEI